MEQLTTYRAKGKEIGLIFLFKYDLNGNLRVFEIQEGELNDEQIKWLFSSRFPANESIIKAVWMKEEKYTKVFTVEVSPADLSFDALWNLYNHKIAKFHAEKAFKKCKEETIIKIFLSIPRYLNYLKSKPGIDQAHLATYINAQYYDNEYPTDKKVGKVHNPVIKDLASKLTHKVNPHG